MTVTLSQVRPNVFSSFLQIFSYHPHPSHPGCSLSGSSCPASPQAHKGYWNPSDKRSGKSRNVPLEKLIPNAVLPMPRKGLVSCLPVPGWLPNLELPESLRTLPAPAPWALTHQPHVYHRELSMCPVAQGAVTFLLCPPVAFSRAR